MLGFAGCLTGDIFLETAEVKVTGTPGDRAGYAINISGDLNSDGNNDLVVTAPQPGINEIYVFFGPIPPSSLSTATPDVVYTGPADSEAGWAITVNEITGDFHPDLVIAAPSENQGDGAVHVLAGPLSPGSYTSADDHSRVYGIGNFGSDVDVGDFNGDSNGDLAVGACRGFSNNVMGGAVYVVDGPLAPGNHQISSVARGHYTGDFHQGGVGCAVAAVGDVGAYGHDALLVGAYQDSPNIESPEIDAAAGAAYLIYEPPSKMQKPIRDVADATFLGAHAVHNAGYSLGGRGDFNGDGFGDVLIGAPGQFCTWYPNFFAGSTVCDIELPPESVHVFLGGGTPAKPGPFGTVEPPVPDLTGTYIVDEGDVNIYASHPNPEVVPTSIHHSTFGMSVAWTNSAGRYRNGMSIDDILIGAPALNRAYLVWGWDNPDEPPPSLVTIEDIGTVFYLGEHADEHAVSGEHEPTSDSLYGPDAAGLAVAGNGDIDHDYVQDVAISAPGQLWYNTGPTKRPGRTFVMYGSKPKEN